LPSLRPSRTPRWYSIPARVLLITLILTLVWFALSLLVSIVGLVVIARLHGVNPDMRMAYRHFALPAGVIGGTIALVAVTAVEIRHYRQSKALSGIARASQ
jgi:hypothetical protein